MPRYQASSFRGEVRAYAVTAPAGRTCPRCGAAPGNSCFKMSSWVVPRVPLKGFFTARQKTFHRDRVAGPVKAPTPVSYRATLRTTVSALAQRKLTATERSRLRGWAGSPRRTVEELEAKAVELRQLSDLAW